ncbi:MAG: Holliday junction branch migration protein RuvA [Dysgonamonadaceae bacterium]|jgi:Holliday junction DNA helicase RuvA|nr:Holliday junction branch migration protein RuvA [Dysgonamonadaceae bacterium]
MLDYIKGEIIELNPASAVVDVNGIGYYIHLSLNTYSALHHQHVAKVYIYEVIREDAHQLFGFTEKRERELFLLLISVSGVGANTARMVLSSLSIYELEAVISSGNSNALKAIKGIGNKTAERIIIDLKDKVKLSESGVGSQKITGMDALSYEAVSALVSLGFNQVVSQKAVVKIIEANPGLTVEEIIKNALKVL